MNHSGLKSLRLFKVAKWGCFALNRVRFGATQALESILRWPTDQLGVDEGIRLGVTVTPAFFIYGRLIVGSLSYS